MHYTTGSTARVFVIRFEEGDSIYGQIEMLCSKENVHAGIVWVVGGVKNGTFVVGPRDQLKRPLDPILESFTEAHEILGIGTIFQNEQGEPKLHMHAGAGKESHTVIGCPRKGLDCWLVTEAILMELNGVDAKRVQDGTGLELLKIL